MAKAKGLDSDGGFHGDIIQNPTSKVNYMNPSNFQRLVKEPLFCC